MRWDEILSPEFRGQASVKNTLLVIASVAVALLIAEIGLAMFYPQDTVKQIKRDFPPINLPSDVLPYRLKPGAEGELTQEEFTTRVHINSLGYRGKEFAKTKGEAIRVIAVGDSFTFGYGVEDHQSYPAVLERRLRQAVGEERVQVINAGFAACYYPDTYYIYLKEFGLELDPDLIVVGLFVGNDLDHWLVGENDWLAVDEAGLPTRIGAKYAKVDADGYNVSKLTRLRYRFPVLRDSHVVQAIVSGLVAMRREQPRHFNHWMYRRKYLERTEQAIDKVQKLLLAMTELARNHGSAILVVLMPAREQLYPEEFPLEQFPFMNDYELDKPQRLMSRFFEEHGIAYLDLLPDFQERALERLYFELDTHWTIRGTELAARLVADHLMTTSPLFSDRRTARFRASEQPTSGGWSAGR